MTADNYPLVWQTLVNKYQNKRRLATHLLDKMLNFKAFPSETFQNLSSFADTFYECVNSLNTLQVNDLGDFVLFYVALQKLPFATRTAFERQFIETEILSHTFEIKLQYWRFRPRVRNWNSVNQCSQTNQLSNHLDFQLSFVFKEFLSDRPIDTL